MCLLRAMALGECLLLFSELGAVRPVDAVGDGARRPLGRTYLRTADLGQYEVVKTAVPAPVVEGRAVAPAGGVVVAE